MYYCKDQLLKLKQIIQSKYFAFSGIGSKPLLIFYNQMAFTIYIYCLVPRPHYSAQPKRFGSRGPNETVRPRKKSSKVRQK